MINCNNDKLFISIQEEPIDVSYLISLMKDKSAGALSIFLGKSFL
jgi:hypothetical protein